MKSLIFILISCKLASNCSARQNGWLRRNSFEKEFKASPPWPTYEFARIPQDKIHVTYRMDNHFQPMNVQKTRKEPYVQERFPVFGQRQYSVLKKIPFEVPVPRPVPIKVPVPRPYTVEKHVPVPVNVYVPQPYTIEKKVPYAVKVRVEEPVPYTVERKVPYEVKIPIERPYIVHVPKPYPVYFDEHAPEHQQAPKDYSGTDFRIDMGDEVLSYINPKNGAPKTNDPTFVQYSDQTENYNTQKPQAGNGAPARDLHFQVLKEQKDLREEPKKQFQFLQYNHDHVQYPEIQLQQNKELQSPKDEVQYNPDVQNPELQLLEQNKQLREDVQNVEFQLHERNKQEKEEHHSDVQNQFQLFNGVSDAQLNEQKKLQAEHQRLIQSKIQPNLSPTPIPYYEQRKPNRLHPEVYQGNLYEAQKMIAEYFSKQRKGLPIPENFKEHQFESLPVAEKLIKIDPNENHFETFTLPENTTTGASVENPTGFNEDRNPSQALENAKNTLGEATTNEKSEVSDPAKPKAAVTANRKYEVIEETNEDIAKADDGSMVVPMKSDQNVMIASKDGLVLTEEELQELFDSGDNKAIRKTSLASNNFPYKNLEMVQKMKAARKKPTKAPVAEELECEACQGHNNKQNLPRIQRIKSNMKHLENAQEHKSDSAGTSTENLRNIQSNTNNLLDIQGHSSNASATLLNTQENQQMNHNEKISGGKTKDQVYVFVVKYNPLTNKSEVSQHSPNDSELSHTLRNVAHRSTKPINAHQNFDRMDDEQLSKGPNVADQFRTLAGSSRGINKLREQLHSHYQNYGQTKQQTTANDSQGADAYHKPREETTAGPGKEEDSQEVDGYHQIMAKRKDFQEAAQDAATLFNQAFEEEETYKNFQETHQKYHQEVDAPQTSQKHGNRHNPAGETVSQILVNGEASDIVDSISDSVRQATSQIEVNEAGGSQASQKHERGYNLAHDAEDVASQKYEQRYNLATPQTSINKDDASQASAKNEHNFNPARQATSHPEVNHLETRPATVEVNSSEDATITNHYNQYVSQAPRGFMIRIPDQEIQEVENTTKTTNEEEEEVRPYHVSRGRHNHRGVSGRKPTNSRQQNGDDVSHIQRRIDVVATTSVPASRRRKTIEPKYRRRFERRGQKTVKV